MRNSQWDTWIKKKLEDISTSPKDDNWDKLSQSLDERTFIGLLMKYRVKLLPFALVSLTFLLIGLSGLLQKQHLSYSILHLNKKAKKVKTSSLQPEYWAIPKTISPLVNAYDTQHNNYTNEVLAANTKTNLSPEMLASGIATTQHDQDYSYVAENVVLVSKASIATFAPLNAIPTDALAVSPISVTIDRQAVLSPYITPYEPAGKWRVQIIADMSKSFVDNGFKAKDTPSIKDDAQKRFSYWQPGIGLYIGRNIGKRWEIISGVNRTNKYYKIAYPETPEYIAGEALALEVENTVLEVPILLQFSTNRHKKFDFTADWGVNIMIPYRSEYTYYIQPKTYNVGALRNNGDINILSFDTTNDYAVFNETVVDNSSLEDIAQPNGFTSNTSWLQWQ
ncbi:MAG: hypothetical protein R2798_08975 [Chitinophagales bacterium]